MLGCSAGQPNTPRTGCPGSRHEEIIAGAGAAYKGKPDDTRSGPAPEATFVLAWLRDIMYQLTRKRRQNRGF